MLHVALKLHKVWAFIDITSLLERCLRQPGASFDQTTLGKPCSNAGCFKEPERWFKASCTKSPNRVVALSGSQIWCKEKFGASCCAEMAPYYLILLDTQQIHVIASLHRMRAVVLLHTLCWHYIILSFTEDSVCYKLREPHCKCPSMEQIRFARVLDPCVLAGTLSGRAPEFLASAWGLVVRNSQVMVSSWWFPGCPGRCGHQNHGRCGALSLSGDLRWHNAFEKRFLYMVPETSLATLSKIGEEHWDKTKLGSMTKLTTGVDS